MWMNENLFLKIVIFFDTVGRIYTIGVINSGVIKREDKSTQLATHYI